MRGERKERDEDSRGESEDMEMSRRSEGGVGGEEGGKKRGGGGK